VLCARLDAILPQDRDAMYSSMEIWADLATAGKPVRPNDTAIAGQAIAVGAV